MKIGEDCGIAWMLNPHLYSAYRSSQDLILSPWALLLIDTMPCHLKQPVHMLKAQKN